MESGNWLENAFVSITGANPILQGFAGGLIVTLLNAAGALLVVIWRRPSEKHLDAALGFGAGVMLTASFTRLILPAIAFGGLLRVLIGVAAGAVALDQADRWIPHLHAVTGREGPSGIPRRAAELADSLRVPPNYRSKILHALARSGVLVSERRRHGGFQLAVPPASSPWPM